MFNKLKSQWFLLTLIAISIVVAVDPSHVLEEIGIAIKTRDGPAIMIFMIFIISGLMLDGEQIRNGIRDTKATALALFTILIAAPATACLIALLPLDTGVVIGLFIVSVMPTTLSSGVVMTRTAGGNMAHALFVTVLSNIIAIFTIPLVLSFLLSTRGMDTVLAIDKERILVKLIILVLLPLLAGLILRSLTKGRIKVEKYKLPQTNQVLILCIVFVSVATAKQAIVGNITALFGVASLTAVFHILLLGTAFLLIYLFKIKKGRYESILFMGGQKTLPLSVMIQVSYFEEFGLALVFCVVHHIVHLITDGYLSARLGRTSTSLPS